MIVPEDPYPYFRLVIPQQLLDIGYQVASLNKPMVKMRSQANFTPFRYIANLAVTNKPFSDPNLLNKEDFICEFDPPITLEIEYTFKDLYRCVVMGKHLRLGLWDGDEWVVLNQIADEFILHAPDRNNRGLCTVTISSWPGDPPLAWGG
ncbi:MAG: hypothetical protein ACKOC5_07310 [Chloroflexota bacterium]